MGFFDLVPPPAAPSQHFHRPAWARPETVLPGLAAFSQILARTDEVVVALSGVRAYPNGFEFTTSVHVREPLRGREAFGHHGFLRRFAGDDLPADFLRLGLRFADGTILTNLGTEPTDEFDTGPRLLPEGGHGGMQEFQQRYWVWPLPPVGRFAVVCEWPARGIPETTTELPSSLILDAAARAVPLF